MNLFVSHRVVPTDEDVLPYRIQRGHPVRTMENRLAWWTSLVNVGDIHFGSFV